MPLFVDIALGNVNGDGYTGAVTASSQTGDVFLHIASIEVVVPAARPLQAPWPLPIVTFVGLDVRSLAATQARYTCFQGMMRLEGIMWLARVSAGDLANVLQTFFTILVKVVN